MTRLMLVAALAIVTSTAAFAHDYKLGSLEIAHPWARATPKGATIGGGYLKITNKGSEPDTLISASSVNAGRTEIHEMAMDGTVMRMRPLPNGIIVKPGETVELKPGSFHVMMLDLKAPLVEGERVKGTLTFAKAGKVDVEFKVDAIAASAGAHNH